MLASRLPRGSASQLADDLLAWLWQRREPLVLTLITVAALAERIVWLDRLEPNVMPDEADNLQVLYRILAGRGPGPFGFSWDGNPVAALYPSLPFLYLFGLSYVAL